MQKIHYTNIVIPKVATPVIVDDVVLEVGQILQFFDFVGLRIVGAVAVHHPERDRLAP